MPVISSAETGLKRRRWLTNSTAIYAARMTPNCVNN
jgi:hypothetical protein